MSRLIVKNLPNKVTKEHLQEVFGLKGEVTDVQLKYTADGKFRNFGFVGYRTDEQAAAAKEYFDGTCINSMQIQVQFCANLGDAHKPRAWSKYAPDSSAYKKLNNDKIDEKKVEEKKIKKVKKSKNKILELLKKHKDDPLFAEFVDAHTNDKTSWIKKAFEKANQSEDENDSAVDEDDNRDNVAEVAGDTKEKSLVVVKEKIANKKISDLEYMKTLMKKIDKTDLEAAPAPTEEKPEEPKKIRNRPLFYVKINGLPFKCKKKDVKEFFRPLVPYSLRLPLGKGKRLAGFCYVGFRTEQELKKALNKDKLFIGNHRIHIHKYDKDNKEGKEEDENSRRKQQEKITNEESIGESGSIFVRNLPYVVSEDELTKLFENFGPLADVNMPIDSISRQPKGFATVTFMMPEHATQAFTALDGTAFCGRMLHLLPAKTDTREDEIDEEGLSFKEKKAKKLKAQAKSSHNWNTLFLGVNAVADVVATNYNTTKEQLLTDANKNTSAAVRLALGETQLVAQTKSFLENNGVYLDSFNKPSKRRSKTCILVKNLPANTEKEEIKPLFEKCGQLARFLMPDHGITALVDFVEPYEAKKAFTKLAYSQFKSSPLYLEWAPENVFTKSVDSIEPKPETSKMETSDSIPIVDKKLSKKAQKKLDKEKKAREIEIKEEINKKVEAAAVAAVAVEESDDLEEPENDTTLFVKNVNFRTTDDDFRAHFTGCGKIYSAHVARKKDPKNPGQLLSMGYGFVQFYRKEQANQALKVLQCSTLDGKTVELKRSERGNTQDVKHSKKSTKDTKQNGTKLLVRNVPFQANSKELHEIFRAFGEIKTLRLPKKLTPGSEQHRGFAFVDFHAKADAKSAFEALCQSTHLYGRRLVLEWADQTDENEDVSALRKRTALAYNAKTPGGKKLRKAEVNIDTFMEATDET